MTVKLQLQTVSASGRRQSWWHHITGIDMKQRSGFNRFTGNKLVAGECELPAMAVLAHVRPIGTAAANERVIDLFYVDPVKKEMVGISYHNSWDEENFVRLIPVVSDALATQRSYLALAERLTSAMDELQLIGSKATASVRKRLQDQISREIAMALPCATRVTCGPGDTPDSVRVVAELSCQGIDAKRLIRCAVPCYDGSGDESFAYLCVLVPVTYENYEEDPESDIPHHHAAARKAAENSLGFYGIHSETPVFDDEGSDRWESLLGEFEWSTASIFDLEGNPL